MEVYINHCYTLVRSLSTKYALDHFLIILGEAASSYRTILVSYQGSSREQSPAGLNKVPTVSRSVASLSITPLAYFSPSHVTLRPKSPVLSQKFSVVPKKRPKTSLSVASILNPNPQTSSHFPQHIKFARSDSRVLDAQVK